MATQQTRGNAKRRPGTIGRRRSKRLPNAKEMRRGKWLSVSAEFEAHKSRRANISHARAVAASEHLRHEFLKQWRPMATPAVELHAIIRGLQAKKVPFVLVGAYAIGSYTGRPRATHDVDILTKSGRNHARAVGAVKALYPTLEARKLPWLTAFFRSGEDESVIDVTFPHRADNEEALRTAVWVEDGGLRYRIPTLEAALANKYGAMLSAGRSMDKRIFDTGDFYLMVQHSLDKGQTPIDLDRAKRLGEMVWPGGGGEELLRLVEDAKTGKAPDLAALLKSVKPSRSAKE